MKRLTAEWVSKAEADFLAASALADAKPPLHDVVCFHCQQCAEKYLKALLQQAGVKIPRIHDLGALLSIVLTHYRLRGLIRGLEFLTRFAIDFRYPGESASKRQASAALRWAGKVRDACRAQLGL